MCDRSNQLAEARPAKSQTYAEDKAYVLKHFPDTTNISVKISTLRSAIKTALHNAEHEIDDFDSFSLQQLLKALKDAGIDPKLHARKLTAQQLADRSSKKAEGKTAQQIAALRSRYQKLAKLDKAAADSLGLDELYAKAKEAGADPDTKTRARDWDKFEKDVAAGAAALFQSGFFIINGKKLQDKHNKTFNAVQVGGSSKSDVQVVHGKNSFYIECKKDYATANYFKFKVTVENGKILYDHKFFLPKTLPDDEKQKAEQLFKDIGLSEFLTAIASSSQAKAAWSKFNKNMDSLVSFIKNDPETAQFSRSLKQLKVFPDDFKQLEHVFDTYLQHYISRYNQLADSIIAKAADQTVAKALAKQFKIDDSSDNEEVLFNMTMLAETVEGEVPVKMPDGDEIWLDELDGKDYDEVEAMKEEALQIERKFNAILESRGERQHNYNALKKIVGKHKIMYLYKLFIGGASRRNGKNDAASLISNMELFSVEDIDLADMAKKISQYYVRHGHCHYMQIADCIFALDKERNALGFRKLPLFASCVTHYSIRLTVADDLAAIKLQVFAKAPSPDSISGDRYSFRQQDANYIGKKHPKIIITI